MSTRPDPSDYKITAFTSFLRAFIRVYSLLISPFLGMNCRFSLTCSAYAQEALARHGAVKGLFLAIRRVLRCHPWHSCAFDDPVPETFSLFPQWLIDWGSLIRYKREACMKTLAAPLRKARKPDDFE